MTRSSPGAGGKGGGGAGILLVVGWGGGGTPCCCCCCLAAAFPRKSFGVGRAAAEVEVVGASLMGEAGADDGCFCFPLVVVPL